MSFEGQKRLSPDREIEDEAEKRGKRIQETQYKIASRGDVLYADAHNDVKVDCHMLLLG